MSSLELTATSWLPVEDVSRYFDVAAPLLFPGHPTPLRELGRVGAQHHLRGIYRVLVRVTTVTFVAEQAATIWATYHRAGRASCDRGTDPNQVLLMVEDHPTLPTRFLEYLSGYLIGTAELTGARDVKSSGRRRVIQAVGSGPCAGDDILPLVEASTGCPNSVRGSCSRQTRGSAFEGSGRSPGEVG